MKDYLRDTDFLSRKGGSALQKKIRDFINHEANIITQIEQTVFKVDDADTYFELQKLNRLKISKSTHDLVNYVINFTLNQRKNDI